MAYAVRVMHSEREQFENQQGWTIKRMDTFEQSPVQKDDNVAKALEPSPIQEEYAPVIFAQDTVAHVVSLDMLSGTVSPIPFFLFKNFRNVFYRPIPWLLIDFAKIMLMGHNKLPRKKNPGDSFHSCFSTGLTILVKLFF